jgi:tetratricopeptide (TPR) repeat protein
MRLQAIKRAAGGFRVKYVSTLVLLLSSALLCSCISTVIGPTGRAPRSSGGRSCPHNPQARRYVVEAAHVNATDPVAAMGLFDKSLALEPDCLKTVTGAALTCLSIVAKSRGNTAYYFKKTIEYANYLIANEHETQDGHYILGLLFQLNHPKESLYHYQQFLAGPKNLQKSSIVRDQAAVDSVYAGIGFAYGALKDYEKSLAYFKKYLATCQNVPREAGTVASVRGLVPQIEKFLKYKRVYEPGHTQMATRTQPKPVTPVPGAKPKPEPRPAPQARPARVEPPAPAHTPSHAGTEAGRREYLRMKEQLEKAFQERNRQLEMLTG